MSTIKEAASHTGQARHECHFCSAATKNGAMWAPAFFCCSDCALSILPAVIADAVHLPHRSAMRAGDMYVEHIKSVFMRALACRVDRDRSRIQKDVDYLRMRFDCQDEITDEDRALYDPI